MSEIDIKLTKYAIASSGRLKVSRISSGVSVIMYNAENKVGAGMHILASNSGPRAPQNPIMYANTAIPYVMEKFNKRGVGPPFSVAIAGGAVMAGANGTTNVGPNVVKAVKIALEKEGLKPKIDQTGEAKIRTMILDIDAGKIKIS